MDQACYEPEEFAKAFLGKRTYFVYPNSVIQDELVFALIREEFEVYLVKDFQKAVALFRRYPDSVVFVNIDEGQPEPEWEMYISTLQNDPDLWALQIGVLTYNKDPSLAQKYLMEMMVSAGFIKLGLGLKESTGIILKVLEANEARGRRKFLRVHTEGQKATFNVKIGDQHLNGTIVDLSVVGMACRFELPLTLSAHTKFDTVQLKLGGLLAMVTGVLMGTRCSGAETVWVILFAQNMGYDIKDKLHRYMQGVLQAQVKAELDALT